MKTSTSITPQHNRSKLYGRYDVEILTSRSSSSDRKWFNEQEEPIDIPLEERSSIELVVMIYKTLHWKSKAIVIVIVILLLSVVVRIAIRIPTQPEPTVERRWMDPDAHKRNNPFAPEGETTYMEGVLEYKRIGGRTMDEQKKQQQVLLRQEHVLPVEQVQNQPVEQVQDQPVEQSEVMNYDTASITEGESGV